MVNRKFCVMCRKVKDGFFGAFPLDENRCRLWVQLTGDLDLVYVPIEKLHQIRYVCGIHFKKKDFTKTGKFLKKRSVPSLHLPHNLLTDEQLQEFPLHVKSAVTTLSFGNVAPSTSQQKQSSSVISQKGFTPLENKLLEELKATKTLLRTLKRNAKKLENLGSPVLNELLRMALRNHNRKPKGYRCPASPMQRLRWSQLLWRRQEARRLFSEEARLRTNEESPLRRLVADASFEDTDWQPREKEDPRHTTVLLFPDEDCAQPGMGKKLLDIPAARDFYQHASEILGWDVGEVCSWTSTAGIKALHEKRDQCVMVTSLASLEAARQDRAGALEKARAVGAGGVGEYSALVYAGALSLESALGVLAVRDAALRAINGGTRVEVVLKVGEKLPKEVCVSGYLGPGRKVVCGSEEAVRPLVSRGIGRILPGPGAYCPVAIAAKGPVFEALKLIRVEPPRLRVVSATTGAAVKNPKQVVSALTRQVTVPVRWEQVIQMLYSRRENRYPLTLILAPGARIRDILRRVNAKAYDNCILQSV